MKEYPRTYDSLSRVMENRSDYGEGRQDERDHKTRLLKRIPLHRLMDLKIDYAFKQLFGKEKNKEIMVVFLNAVLQKTGRNPIKDVSFLNTEAGGEYVDDKQSRLDLFVVTDKGERINVEIQFTNKYDMVKRSLYYWSGIYRSALKKRMGYKELPTVISINILNFSLINETKHFHTTYHLYEDEEQFRLTDVMEFHYIEMTKLIKAWKEEKLNPWNDVLARWLLMLGMVDHRSDKIYKNIYRELEEIAMKDETLRNAFQNWEELSKTQEEFLAYESRLKRILDEEAAQREAELRIQEAERIEEEARRKEEEAERIEGEAKRREEKARERVEEAKRQKEKVRERAEEAKKKSKDMQKRVARRLLSMGIALEEVAKTTELSKDEVIEMEKERRNVLNP